MKETKRAIAGAIAGAFPTPIQSTTPKVPLGTISQRQDLAPVERPGLAGSPRDRTIARAGIRTPDLTGGPAPIPHPGPTGGPVGNYGPCGAIGPWGSWK